MYTIYNYAASSTAANVIADLVKVLTGTTAKSSLSANCVQANSSITATVAAGWAVFDSAAGANSQVLRALNSDGSTYKYMQITVTTTTIQCQLYESWNATTHVGTNQSNGSLTQALDLTGGGYLYVFATARYCIIQPWISTGYQNLYGNSVIEVSRDSIPAGYPVAFLLTGAAGNAGGTAGFMPRLKSNTATGDNVAANAPVTLGPLMAFANGSTPLSGNQQVRDASDTISIAVYKVGLTSVGTVNNFIQLGVSADLLMTGFTTGSTLDELVYGGINYVILKAGSCSLLVPKQ